MNRFEFRLERVLEYRRLTEGWAKDAYLEARSRRLEAENVLKSIAERRAAALAAHPASVEHLRSIEAYLERLDNDERAGLAALSVLEQEEVRSRDVWRDKKKDAEIVEKLRTQREDEWKVDVARAEQSALDEWATMRRRAA